MSHNEIERFIRELNDCWQQGRLADLARFYHPDVVLLPPDIGEPIVGRDRVVASYGEFAEAAVLHDFNVERLQVFAFAGTALCHMHFAMHYTLGDTRCFDRGLEIYAISTTGTAPQIVWRSQNLLESSTQP